MYLLSITMTSNGTFLAARLKRIRTLGILAEPGTVFHWHKGGHFKWQCQQLRDEQPAEKKIGSWHIYVSR